MLAKIEGVNYTAIIGESAKIDVKQAINYIKSGQAEISETVGDIIGEFNDNAVEKTNTFNQNAIDKTAEFDLNASNKTGAFNTNATNKTTNYNDNATSKTGVFDSNAVDKTNDFNLNASNKTTDFNNNYLEKKALIDAEVAKSKTWAEGTDGEVAPLGGTHSSKGWAKIAEEAASGVQNPANRDLSNLTNTGQMIIDSQNGTISNCILEIPQNIKMILENGILTLKAGSIVTHTGSTYATTTTSSDISINFTNYTYSTKVVVFYLNNILSRYAFSEIASGSALPAESQNGILFFNTTDKYFYYRSSTQWNKYASLTYPVCIVEKVNNVWQFVKDSNGNDMIFNGAGFIRDHAFVYPGIKALVSDRYNDDGSLKSRLTITNSLQIYEMGGTGTAQDWYVRLYSNGQASSGRYREYNTIENIDVTGTIGCYIRNQNAVITTSTLAQTWYTPLINFESNGITVTKFDIRQPYEGARNLLTDDIEKEVATKQVDVTTLTGYDSTQTQTLKNINGVLTWVTD